MSISLQKKALNKNTILFFIGIVFSTILSSTLTIHGKSLPNNCPQNIYVDKSVIAFPKVNETQNVFQLITHGRPGELFINGEWKNKEKIAQWLLAIGNQQSVAKGQKPIADSRQPIAHLNIYSCNFAEGAKGLAAVSYLEKTLGVSVAASTNITGKDGDWILEVGQPVATLNIPDYQGNLQTTQSCAVNIIQNPSFETYASCPVSGQINSLQSNASFWTAVGTTELMVYAPPCYAGDPVGGAGGVWASAQLTGGHNSTAWVGFHGGERAINTLSCTLQPGTYTVTFWGGYAVDNSGIYTTGAPVGVYTTAGTLLGTSATLSNRLSPTNQTWQQYSITFTTTTALTQLAFGAAGAGYLYIDDFTLLSTSCATAPVLTATNATNICPATGVNLNSYVSNAGLKNIVWFTNNTHTGSPITTSGSASAGTYYAFFYDAANNCYSPVSSAITVSISSCIPTGSVCGNINYFKNPSFETYSICPLAPNTKVTNGVCGWMDAGYADPQLLVYNPTGGCVYNYVFPDNDPTSQLTQGHTGVAWMGLQNSDFTNFAYMHPLLGVLEAPLQPGTHTLTFWGARLNDAQYNNNPVVKLYGVDSLHQQPWTTGFYGEVTGTINPTLGTVTVTNVINNTTSNWQKYTITFTTTKVYKGLVIYHQTANAYLMVDDMELLEPNPNCCPANSNNQGLYCDYDGDGLLNWQDLDDDNDGIVDAVENPSCFYTAAELNTKYPTFATTAQNICTGLINLGSFTSIYNAFDGNVTLSPPTSGYSNYSTFQGSQNWGGKTLYSWNYMSPLPVLGFTMLSSTSFPIKLGYTGSTIMLMGSTDGVTWQQLSQAVAADVSTNIVLNNTLQPNSYFKYYKIIGVTGMTNNTDYVGSIVEVVPNVNGALYVPSSNPKPTCTSQLDTDGDGIANMFDLDSDGDGCSDAIEGGAAFNYTNLSPSSIPGGNTGTTYTGTANYGVTSNLGNTVGSTSTTVGIPTVANTGQTVGTSQNVGQKDADCCSAGTTAPILTSTTATNLCPATGVNLNSYVSNVGLNNLVWFTNNTHTGSPITTSGSAGAGIYYAFFYDATNNCYSLVSPGLSVSINACTPVSATCSPVEYITNSSFECYANTCVTFNTGLLPTNKVCGWYDGTAYDPTFMVYDGVNNCIYNMPTTYYPTTAALTGGHTGKAWMGIGQSSTSAVHALVNTMQYTLAPGTHTLTFWAAVLPQIHNGYGIVSAGTTDLTVFGYAPGELLDFGGDGTLTGKALGSTPVITNFITSNNQTWVKYTMTFTNTTPMNRISFKHFNNAYVYIDDISIMDANQMCCTTADKTGMYCDFDSDGVLNVNDLDDDNDGILDANENPSCFYTATEVTGNASTYATTVKVPILTEMAMSGAFWSMEPVFDGVNPYAVNSLPPVGGAWAFLAQDWINKTIIQWQYNAAIPVTQFTIYQNNYPGYVLGTPGSTLKLQGSTDGTNWLDLSSPTDAYVDKAFSLYNTLQAGVSFNYYRIRGVSGSSLAGNKGIVEIAPTINTTAYSPSVNPKPTCTSPLDTDMDGIANMFDLDSDGDGCSDAVEGGAAFNSSNLFTSTIPGGNSGTNYAGTANYGVTDNLGNIVGSTGTTIGVPTSANTGQTVGTSQNVGQKDPSCCLAGTTAPSLIASTATNICPATGVNLSNYVPASSFNVVWFTNNTRTGSPITTYGSAGAGTYYAFFFDAINNCYSPASAPLTVSITTCVPVTTTCSPKEYITNGSFTCRTTAYCPNLNTGTIKTNEVCGWADGTVFDPTFMVYDPTNACNYNMPYSNWPAASAITSGHNSLEWFGIETTTGPGYGHVLVNLLSDTLQPGTHTITFWAGIPSIKKTLNYPSTSTVVPTPVILYGWQPSEAPIWGGPTTIPATPTYGKTLGTSIAVSNVLTANSTSSDWVKYSITFTTTTPIDKIAFLQTTTNGYVYIDDVSMLDANTDCCLTSQNNMGPYCDFDGDGIINSNDLDDDNDGILDADENPSCFVTASQVGGNMGSYATTINGPIKTDLYQSNSGHLGYMAFDGVIYLGDQRNTAIVVYNQDWINKALYSWEYKASIPISSFTIKLNSWIWAYSNGPTGFQLGSSGSSIKLQGSTNGSTWVDLSTPVNAYNDKEIILINSLQATSSFKFYRILGVTGTTNPTNVGYIDEIVPTINSSLYIPSSNPKPACTSPLDTDGDGIANMFDLDSDGDGCADAIEGGATFTSSNLFASGIPGGNTGTSYSGIVNYGVTNNLGNNVELSGYLIGVPKIAGTGQTVGTSENVGQKDPACCNAGTVAMTLSATSISNVCPTNSVNLTNLLTSSCPVGSSLEWHTNNTSLSANNLVTNPSTVLAGIYYAVCHDITGSCYSPTSQAVVVTINNCQKLNPDFNVTLVNVLLSGSVATNDANVPTGSIYGTPIPQSGNPSSCVPSMSSNGSYTFICSTPGQYNYLVPVCPVGVSTNCPLVPLEITVTNPSSPSTNGPIANTDITSTPLNIPVTIKSLVNDASGNPATTLNPASVTVTKAPLHGSTIVDPATGNIVYIPAPNYVGVDTLTYQVCDMLGKCATAKQIITVLATNAPNSTVASDDYNTTTMNTPVSGSVMTNDSDPQGNTQTVTPQPSTTISGKGTLTLSSNGTYTFTPATSYVGPVDFPYTTCDNGIPQACATATLHITINPVAQTLNPDFNVTPVNVVLTGNVSTNDANVPTGTTYGTPIPQSGNPSSCLPTISSGGGYSFVCSTPGQYNYLVPVCAPGVTTNCPLVPLEITVTNPSAPSTNGPIANTDIASTPVSTPVTLKTLANDASGNPATTLNPASVTVTKAPLHGSTSVNTTTGDITYTPTAGYVGTDTLTYQVCDMLGKCATAKQIITILPTTAPNSTVASDDYNKTTMNTPVSGNVMTNDSDPQGNTQTVTPQPSTTISGKGTLTLNSNGTYTFTPATGYVGPVDFPYTTCDNGTPQACATATLHITINPAAQTLNPDFNVTPVNVVLTGNVSTNDANVPTGSTYGTPIPQSGNPSSCVPTISSGGGYSFVCSTPGQYNYLVPVCAPGVTTNCPLVPLEITVTNPSAPSTNGPIANTDIASTPVSTPVTLKTLANDASGNPATTLNPASVTVTKAPLHGSTTVNTTTGDITFTPTAGYVGTDTLTYQVCDMLGKCATAKQIITILPTTAPNSTVASDDYNKTTMNTPVSGNVMTNDSDPQGNTQTVTPQSATMISGKGTLTLNSNGTYTFTPSTGYVGPVDFPYTTCDNGTPQACATATLHITINPANKLTILPKAYLQGALFGVLLPDVLMRDDLRTKGLIPTTSPYIAMGMSGITSTNTTTTAVVGTTSPSGADAIVDWVFVELRDGSNNTVVVDSRSALIQRDGDIVDVDGVSPLYFNVAQPGNYYVVVKHRNHLGVMSTLLPLSFGTNTIIDFRKATTPTFNLDATTAVNQAQVVVDQGRALWAGNALYTNTLDGKHSVIFQGTDNDVNVIYQQVINATGNLFVSPAYKLKGYYAGDINMNGEVIFQGTTNDVEFIYQNVIKNHPGNILVQPFFKIREQLP